jgi:hypothetical protein
MPFALAAITSSPLTPDVHLRNIDGSRRYVQR